MLFFSTKRYYKKWKKLFLNQSTMYKNIESSSSLRYYNACAQKEIVQVRKTHTTGRPRIFIFSEKMSKNIERELQFTYTISMSVG